MLTSPPPHPLKTSGQKPSPPSPPSSPNTTSPSPPNLLPQTLLTIHPSYITPASFAASTVAPRHTATGVPTIASPSPGSFRVSLTKQSSTSTSPMSQVAVRQSMMSSGRQRRWSTAIRRAMGMRESWWMGGPSANGGLRWGSYVSSIRGTCTR